MAAKNKQMLGQNVKPNLHFNVMQATHRHKTKLNNNPF